MEAAEWTPSLPTDHLDQAAFKIYEDTKNRYGVENNKPLSGSAIREARGYALQLGLLEGAATRLDYYLRPQGKTLEDLKQADSWEQASKAATEGNWSLLKERINTRGQELQEESATDPSSSESRVFATAFLNLAKSLGD